MVTVFDRASRGDGRFRTFIVPVFDRPSDMSMRYQSNMNSPTPPLPNYDPENGQKQINRIMASLNSSLSANGMKNNGNPFPNDMNFINPLFPGNK